MRIIKHIKIRIGEPLTAVASNEKGIAFGSISGYIGYYCRTKKEVYYVKEVFEELIRSIQFITPDTAYACVGDECGLILNFRDVERIVYDVIQYSKSHNLSQCPNTIPFLHNHTCLLVPFPSTNTKETQIESYYKQSSWLIDYEDRSQNDIGKIAIASFSVPYGFNGRKLLWLEYHENKEKVLTTYDVNKQTVDKIHTFAPKSGYDFIAHVKWYNEQLVLVKNLKTVEVLDPATEKVQTLYQHKSHIIALEIFHPKTPETTPHFDKDIEIGFKHEEEKFSDQELKSASRNLTVVSIDYSELLYLYEGNKLNKVVELRKLPGFPELPKNTYLFDMGYPYYVCIDSKSIAFTSDIGLFIIDYI